MADDGMLLNFDLGDVSIKPQVKFKGGAWRDRRREERSVKPRPEDANNTPLAERRAAPNREGFKEREAFAESERPAKRQRTEGGMGRQDHGGHGRSTGGPHADNGGERDGGRPRKSGQITSRLFTSNPTPKMTFDEPGAQAAEPVNPSNAPLSGEAETFHALGLSRRLALHLSSKLEMKAPTSIQKNTIPQLVGQDSDAFLQAETGSGKTLAYLLPMVQRIMALSHNEDGSSNGTKIHRDSGLFAIVLAPTRELCKQIATVLDKVLRCAPWIVSTTVIGGESKKSEKARIRKGVNILIATPGRLTDHLDHTKVLDVGTVRWLVLDEGDRLMEMGFEQDLRMIVGKIREEQLKRSNKEGVVLDGILPSRRVTVLCSATMKMNVQKLGQISLEDAVHITASKPDTNGEATDDAEVNEAIFAAPSQLKQSYLIVPAKLRLVTLIALLKESFARKGSVMKAIIFISCADSVNYHFDLLKSTSPVEQQQQASIPADSPPPLPDKSETLTAGAVAPAAYITSPANSTITLHKLHGSLPQPVRTATLKSFTVCKDPAVLITTDISSRGLDVPAVDLVVEYDPAFSTADHVHRIGRTARAGRPGKAALFLMPGCEEGYISLLQSGNMTSQLYDTLLQKGLSTPVALPPGVATHSGEDAAAPTKQSWAARAEALQLHLEQRLLAAAPDGDSPSTATTEPSPAKKNAKDGRQKWSRAGDEAKARTNPLLDAARQAFRSHVRAYATHVREERHCFDITQLHLGHAAKSFGLREAPGNLGGGGVSRRTHKTHASGGVGGKRSGGAGGDDSNGAVGGGRSMAAADEDAARRMREKMKGVMSAGAEFNIG